MTKSKNPATTFKYSSHTEALRILFTAKKIAIWQYQTHKFLVLPDLSKNSPANTIHFPQLDYTSIPNFWSDVKKVKEATPPTAPENLIAKTRELIEGSEQGLISDAQIRSLQDNWQGIENQVWEDIKYILPTRFKLLKKLIIYPTRYGTRSSYSLVTPKSPILHIYLRIDTPPGTFITSIISGLIRKPLQSKLHFTWEESTAATNAFVLISRLSRHCENYQSTLASTKSIQQANLAKRSQDYLSQLGFGYKNLWGEVGNNIYFNNKIISNLTRQEFQILSLLIKHSPKTVSFDKLGNKLWPNPDNFSLWGITKAIQRLRTKLTQNNISPHTIQAHRKCGYSLVSTPKNRSTNDKIF